jgi:hypothetical protein
MRPFGSSEVLRPFSKKSASIHLFGVGEGETALLYAKPAPTGVF